MDATDQSQVEMIIDRNTGAARYNSINTTLRYPDVSIRTIRNIKSPLDDLKK